MARLPAPGAQPAHSLAFAIGRRSFQLATLVDDPPTGADWVFERKLDGYRAIADVRPGRAPKLVSRNGLSLAERFPNIVGALSRIVSLHGCVVDGEIVAYDGDRISFQAMQRAIQDVRRPRSAEHAGREVRHERIEFILFDLLAAGGRDLRRRPLTERRARLLARAPREGAVRALGYLRDGRRAIERARELGDEGIIAKRKSAPYLSGRSVDWQKIKLTKEDDFVVIGWSPSKVDPNMIGSLALATRDEKTGPLRYAGRVGTGFDRGLRQKLATRLRRLRVASAPIDVPRDAGRGIVWAGPKIVARVGFLNYTDSGLLRHPTFQGEREDLDAKDVVRERPRD